MGRTRALGLSLLVVLVLLVVQGLVPSAAIARAAVDTYTLKLKKGVSNTVFGQKFNFTGNGTLTVDTDTGEFSYSFDLSNGLTFEGEGTLAQTVNDDVFGLATATSAGGIVGSVIITGKLKANGNKFVAGKLYVAIPNRLGPPPDGFVYTTAKVSGTRQ